MFSFDKLWIWWKSLVEFLYMYKFEVWDFKILNDRELYKIIKSHGPKESPLSCNLFDLYYELMGSNHQTVNLVPPISQFVFRKRTHNEYLLKIFIDSELVVWWFDPMSSLLYSNFFQALTLILDDEQPVIWSRAFHDFLNPKSLRFLVVMSKQCWICTMQTRHKLGKRKMLQFIWWPHWQQR